jgi:hypothetical protein
MLADQGILPDGTKDVTTSDIVANLSELEYNDMY